MARDFSYLARFWVETYGKDITRLPRDKMVEIANHCIKADIVHSMEPVRPEEGIYLAAAVEIALDDDSRAKVTADAAMPKLTGTNKQILWAELIRRDAIAAARLLRQRVMRQMDELTVMRLDAFVTLVLRKESKAKWFIDNRADLTDFPMVIKGESRNSTINDGAHERRRRGCAR